MTANITLGVGEADHVIRVPNSALRYKPQGDAVNNVLQSAANNEQQQPAAGSGGSNSGASQTNRFANIDTTGMSPQDVEIVKKLSDPSLSSDDRRTLMQQLSDDGRQKVRQQMQIGGGRQQGQQAGSDSAKKPSAKGNDGVAKDAVGVPVQKGYVASGISPEAAEKIQFPEPRTDIHRRATIWTLDKNNKLTQHNVTIGLTDGQYTEIVSGDLKDGDVVVIGQTIGAGSAKPATPAANPFGGGGGGGPRGR
jgi:HlyD family secretion protein